MPRNARLRLESLEARETPSSTRLFAVGQDVGNRVYVYEASGASQLPGGGIINNSGSGRLVAGFDAYDSQFNGGVRVVLGDVTGDGIDDVVTAPASGGGPHVKVFDGAQLLNGRAVVVREFMAFDPNFRGGVYVATSQIDESTYGHEIIVGAGEGGGPHVRVFGMNRNVPIRDFFAFDPSFRGGVRVAATSIDNDGDADIIAAMGPGGLPMVRIFDVAGTTARKFDEFLAYDRAFTGGVYVAAGSMHMWHTRGSIITGAGEGGSPHVKVWASHDGPISTPDRPVAMKYSFFAGPASSRTGARVTLGNLGQTIGSTTIYVGEGAGPGGSTSANNLSDPRLRAYRLSTFMTMVTPGYNGPGSFVDYAETTIELFDAFANDRGGGLNLG